MPSVQITTRVGCTNACVYCPQDTLIKAYRGRSDRLYMSIDLFQAYLSKIPADVNIWFAGMCEPWTNLECTQMLLHAHNRGHKVSVFTTLVGMQLSDVTLFESIPFGFFQVHLPSSRDYERIPVTEPYLELLTRLLASDICLRFHCHGGTVHARLRSLLRSHDKPVDLRSLYTRSGNVVVTSRRKGSKKRGVIGCARNLLCNVLLPNGDVLLCSNDYGMKHVLGNLNTSDYMSLFEGNEFLKITRGLRDESEDILCRYCDNFCYDVDMAARFFNSSYRLERYLYYLRDIKRLSDFRHFMQKGVKLVKERARRMLQT